MSGLGLDKNVSVALCVAGLRLSCRVALYVIYRERDPQGGEWVRTCPLYFLPDLQKF